MMANSLIDYDHLISVVRNVRDASLARDFNPDMRVILNDADFPELTHVVGVEVWHRPSPPGPPRGTAYFINERRLSFHIQERDVITTNVRPLIGSK
jgi:hypothetical protein